MTTQTLVIKYVNEALTIVPPSAKPKKPPECVAFRNDSDAECVVWLSDEAALGVRGFHLDPLEKRQYLYSGGKIKGQVYAAPAFGGEPIDIPMGAG